MYTCIHPCPPFCCRKMKNPRRAADLQAAVPRAWPPIRSALALYDDIVL